MISGEAERRERLRADLGLLLMVVLWAVNFSIAKLALQQIDPLVFNALRFPLAALAVVIALWSSGGIRLPQRVDVPRIIMLAVLGNVIYQLFFIFGLDRSRAGNASVLLAGTPVMTALLSAYLGHEQVRPRTWIGVGATLVGIVLVAFEDGFAIGSETFAGDLMLLGASAAWAVFTVNSRPLVERYGSIAVTVWTLWVGTAMLVVIGMPSALRADLGAVSPGAWAAVFYSGVLSIGISYLLWNNGVRVVGNTRTASFSNLVPIVAILTAWLWLGERPSVLQIVGAAVIIAGVTIARSGSRPRAPRAPAVSAA